MKNLIVVTGGTGFVKTNLIKFLLEKTSFKIISLDDYSSGSKKNHIRNKNIIYINGDTKNISQILIKYKKKIKFYFILVSFQEFIKASFK